MKQTPRRTGRVIGNRDSGQIGEILEESDERVREFFDHLAAQNRPTASRPAKRQEAPEDEPNKPATP